MELASPQPMSLMTISTSSLKTSTPRRGLAPDDHELLTLRILEASERKMLLIKELLSPEEFSSLSSDLFAPLGARQSLEGDPAWHAGLGGDSRAAAPDVEAGRQLEQADPQLKTKRLRFANSKSVPSQSVEPAGSSADIKASLDKRRRDVAFFFGGEPAAPPAPAAALESRPGQHLERDRESEVLDGGGGTRSGLAYLAAALISLLCALVDLFRRDDAQQRDSTSGELTMRENGELAARFFSLHKAPNAAPYNRRCNLQAALCRLKADKQLEKFLALSRSHLRTGPTKTKRTEQQILSIRRSDSDTKLRLIGLRRNWWIATKRSRGASFAKRSPRHAPSILVHHPSVEALAKTASKMSGLFPVEKLQRRFTRRSFEKRSSAVSVRLEQISVEEHKLMHREATMARKLASMFEQYHRLRALLRLVDVRSERLLAKYRSQLEEAAPVAASKLLGRLLGSLELGYKLLARVAMKQLRLSIVWSELEALRASQSYRMTTLELVRLAPEAEPDGQSVVERLSQTLADKLRPEERELVADQLDRLQKLLKAEQRRIEGEPERHRLELVHRERPGSAEVPTDELERKRKLGDWLKSFQISVRARFQHDGAAKLRTSLRQSGASPDQFGRLKLSNNPNRSMGLAVVDHAGWLQLEFSVSDDASSVLGSLANMIGRRVSRTTVEVPMKNDADLLNGVPSIRTYEIRLDLPQTGEDDEEDEPPPAKVLLEFSVEYSPLHADAQSEGADRVALAQAILVERLYARLFVAERNPFEDTAAKLAKLLNRIDRQTLVQLMREMGFRMRGPASRYCVVGAELASFERVPESGLSSDLLINHRPADARCVLLARRWVELELGKHLDKNSMGRQPLGVVYLSDRENLHKIGTLELDSRPGVQLEDFRSRLASKAAEASGYKSIEFARSLAAEYLKRVEDVVGQILEAHYSAGDEAPEASRAASRQRRVTARDLLVEPRLRLARPHFSIDLAQVVRALTPRPAARRPLMPKRRRQDAASGISLKLSQLADQARFASDHSSGSELDLAALGRWWKSRAGQSEPHDNLRLIVTIQRATNVPLRSVVPPPMMARHQQQQQQQHQFLLASPMPLSGSSPFSPSPIFSGAGSPMGLAALPMQQRLLVPATTYVEAIFQREQLASSLAQGRDPAWNETLFFHVDLTRDSAPEAAQAGAPRMQLVDECLQLNLYDCRSSYLQNQGDSFEPLAPDLEGFWPLEGLPVQTDPLAAASGGANRLLVAQRRIERQLIGSLRIPISGLLTTGGRAEGTFPLCQPLLLDSYQFEPEWMQIQAGGRRQQVAGELTADSSYDAADNQATYLSLFITLDPPVSLPLSVPLPATSHERADVFEFAKLWERTLLRFQPPSVGGSGLGRSQTRSNQSRARLSSGRPSLTVQRHLRALVLRNDARYSLACRYLTPMRPPAALLHTRADSGDSELNQRDDQMRRLARFVSLLSPLKYGLFRTRSLASSIWFEPRQLLADQLGGHEEKAALLCSYFLQLGKCSALVLGESLQSGRCALVLTWSEQLKTGQLELQMDELLESLAPSSATGSHDLEPVDAGNFIARLPILVSPRSCHLWDPVVGVRYELGAQGGADRLPLVSVGSVITPENVYVNVQPVQHAARLSYDVRQKNLWFPLFAPVQKVMQPTPEQVVANCASVKRESRRIVQLSWRRKLACLELLSKLVGRPQFGPGGSGDATTPIPGAAKARPDPAGDIPQIYTSFNADQCRELRDAIERSIKAHLLTWRPTRPTYFNRTLSLMIADKLASFERRILRPELEGESGDPSDRRDDINRRRMATNPDWWRADLAELIRSETSTETGLGMTGLERQVISWPANLAYTSMQPIVEGLYASGVHNSDLTLDSSPQTGAVAAHATSLSTQFLVAVHVEPYPARVMSVWLYVGALVANTSGRPV